MNPTRTSQVIDSFQSSLPQDTENTIATAQSRSKEWANTPAPLCGAILYKALDIMGRRAAEVAEAITIEEG